LLRDRAKSMGVKLRGSIAAVNDRVSLRAERGNACDSAYAYAACLPCDLLLE
jgi:hypothetical protein